MSSTKGDPPPPGGGGSDPSANVSDDSEVQTSRSADIKPPTATEDETADADPPIIISGGQ